MSDEQNVWPPYLMIRDTRLHDDIGGAGQRIYTTAGQGYEKRKYILADAPADPAGVIVRNARNICFHEGCQYEATQQENKRLRARITELENAMASVRANIERSLGALR